MLMFQSCSSVSNSDISIIELKIDSDREWVKRRKWSNWINAVVGHSIVVKWKNAKQFCLRKVFLFRLHFLSFCCFSVFVHENYIINQLKLWDKKSSLRFHFILFLLFKIFLLLFLFKSILYPLLFRFVFEFMWKKN